MILKNRLSQEISPYLQQHETNPVDWHAWGAEAFSKARAENKPVFLSIGYSTCHWCHVMAHESFDNPDVAAVLNEYFISIKVDREERPDVDRLYMAFVQGMTGSGGWPMSVWLTPDAQPFFGGTYFPPEDRQGQPGFVTVLERIAELWVTGKGQLLAQAADIIQALKESQSELLQGDTPPVDALSHAAKAFAESFDPVHGGFGRAPKFPRPSVLNFLFRHAHRMGSNPQDDILHTALHTLRKMDAGGMHDHMGGGFHRYSVDECWHVPHFEKMLYDQAQLACAYLDAWLISGDPIFIAPVRDTLDYVLRNLTHKDGGFFSAEDADSLIEHEKPEHAEGAFYVWSMEEIQALLPKDVASVAIRHWGIEANGNVLTQNDPHKAFEGKNILFRQETASETATTLGLTVDTVEKMISCARTTLFQARETRPRPHRDDKVLTAWNGLIISAFAKAGACLGEQCYLNAARDAAQFIRQHLTDPSTGDLWRTWRDGIRGETPAFAEDYAFLIQGLLDLYEASFDISHLQWAIALQGRQDVLFKDSLGGGYFTGLADDPFLPIRTKEDYDGAEPTASAVSAMNLLRLSRMLHDEENRQAALSIFSGFSNLIQKMPTAVPQMLAALEMHHSPSRQLVIAGDPTSPDTQALLANIRSRYTPDAVVLLADGATGQKLLTTQSEAFSSMKKINGKAALYRCENFSCQHPLTMDDIV